MPTIRSAAGLAPTSSSPPLEIERKKVHSGQGALHDAAKAFLGLAQRIFILFALGYVVKDHDNPLTAAIDSQRYPVKSTAWFLAA